MTAQTGRQAAQEPVSRARSAQPVVGVALCVIGVVHVLVTPLLFEDAVRSVLDAGVVASIDADPALVDLRSAGFWYVTAGLGLIMLGVMVSWAERRLGTVPYALVWLLIALAVWGLVLMPVSPFWAFLVVAALAFRSARQAPAH